MFCPKCGTSSEENASICSNCGLEFSTIDIGSLSPETETTQISEIPVPLSEKKSSHLVKKIIFCGLAAIVLIMFLIAAARISDGGMSIMQIQSVGGETLEEAYYAELGEIYSGFALISSAIGIFFASVLVWLGFKK